MVPIQNVFVSEHDIILVPIIQKLFVVVPHDISEPFQIKKGFSPVCQNKEWIDILGGGRDRIILGHGGGRKTGEQSWDITHIWMIAQLVHIRKVSVNTEVVPY